MQNFCVARIPEKESCHHAQGHRIIPCLDSNKGLAITALSPALHWMPPPNTTTHHPFSRWLTELMLVGHRKESRNSRGRGKGTNDRDSLAGKPQAVARTSMLGTGIWNPSTKSESKDHKTWDVLTQEELLSGLADDSLETGISVCFQNSLIVSHFLLVCTYIWQFPSSIEETSRSQIPIWGPRGKRRVVKHYKYSSHYNFKSTVGGLAEKLNSQGGEV